MVWSHNLFKSIRYIKCNVGTEDRIEAVNISKRCHINRLGVEGIGYEF